MLVLGYLFQVLQELRDVRLAVRADINQLAHCFRPRAWVLPLFPPFVDPIDLFGSKLNCNRQRACCMCTF